MASWLDTTSNFLQTAATTAGTVKGVVDNFGKQTVAPSAPIGNGGGQDNQAREAVQVAQSGNAQNTSRLLWIGGGLLGALILFTVLRKK